MQALERILADSVPGHHAADSHAHGGLGLLCHQDAVLGLLQTADPAGVSPIDLLLGLLASENGLTGVDDDDVVTAVGVGGVGNLGLAAQQIGSPDGGLAKRLTGGVQDLPLALDVGLVGHKSGHGTFPPYINLIFFTNQELRVKIGTRILIPWKSAGVNTIFIYILKSS